MKRRRRAGELVCWCGGYTFPHRFLGGACNGGKYVEDVFDRHTECRDCHLRVEVETEYGYTVECQALQGLEPPTQCPSLQEHIRYHGVQVYGVNK